MRGETARTLDGTSTSDSFASRFLFLAHAELSAMDEGKGERLQQPACSNTHQTPPFSPALFRCQPQHPCGSPRRLKNLRS